jgi:hypothetical protein
MSVVRSFLTALTGFVLGACTYPASTTTVFAQATTPGGVTEWQDEDIRAKTIALVSPTLEVPFCGGVWVGDSSFLTAYHCVEPKAGEAQTRVGYAYVVPEDVFEPGDLHVKTRIGQRVARVVATDAEHDLALLRAAHPLPVHRNARVVLDSLKQGSFVSTMGHPMGLWWSFSAGQVSAIRYKGITNVLIVQVIIFIVRGSSGGGFWDANNSLVGITSACLGLSDDPNHCSSMNVFTHAQYLDALLRRQDWL